MTPCFFRVTTVSSTSQLLALVGFLCLLQCGSKNEIPFWLDSNQSQLLLSYNRPIQQNLDIGIPQNQSRPEFDNCLNLRPIFYRLNETGVNISYCSTLVDSRFNQFVSTVFSNEPTAFPAYQTGDVFAKVVTPAQLRDTLGAVRLLYCENDCKNGFHLIAAEQTFISTPFQLLEDSNFNIPRRFYQSEASIAISDSIWLLYRLPYNSRILAVKIGTEIQAQQVIDFFTLEVVTQVHKTFIEDQTIEFGKDLFISGSYSGATGGAGNEQLIFSSTDRPIKTQVEIQDNRYWLTMFANSSVVLHRDNPIGFKYQTEPNLSLISANNQKDYLTIDQFKPLIEVFDRVAIRKTFDTEFIGEGICLFSKPCSPSDLPISIAIEFDKKQKSKICSIQDIDIVEVNPFGIFVEGKTAIDIGGKFLELAIYNDCVNRSLYLKQDDIIIGLPEYLHQGVLLVTAEKSYFNTNSIENSSIRRLKPTPISVHDSTSFRLLNIEPIDWIYGSRDKTPGLSSVHSLVNQNDLLVFHNKSCTGLRLDYCRSHSMSPGYIEPNLSNSEFLIEPKISEILPYLNNRFIEIFCRNCYGQTGRIDIVIERSSDNSIRHFAIPIPHNSIVSISPTTVCGGLSIRFSDLYLPASAAIYQLGHYRLNELSEFEFQVIDTWAISQSLYNKARSAQSSIITDGSSIFESTDDIPDGCTIHSSPNTTQIKE